MATIDVSPEAIAYRRQNPPKRSFWWEFRIKAVTKLARMLGVPIAVHNEYFNV